MSKNNIKCDGCEFIQSYDLGIKQYYCDHQDRVDDMGKLKHENILDLCPEWCPKRIID